MTSVQTTHVLNEQLSKLPEVLRKTILGGKVRNVTLGIVELYEMSAEQETALENEIVMTLLGYKSIMNLEGGLKNLIPEDTSILENVLTAYEETIFTEDIVNALVEIDQSSGSNDSESALAKEIAAVESHINTVSPVRTMESDMHNHTPDEPVVQSAGQEELLKKKAEPVVETPEYTLPEAKWETDTDN